MKKRIVALILTAIIVLMAFCSCGAFAGDVAEQGDVTVVVENADGSFDVYKTYLENVENKKEGAVGIIENLRDREKNSLSVEMSDSGYGPFVTAIGSLKADDSAHTYISFYTSLASDSYEGASTVNYDGITLYYSGFGLNGMTVNAGTVILFRIETY